MKKNAKTLFQPQEKNTQIYENIIKYAAKVSFFDIVTSKTT